MQDAPSPGHENATPLGKKPHSLGFSVAACRLKISILPNLGPSVGRGEKPLIGTSAPFSTAASAVQPAVSRGCHADAGIVMWSGYCPSGTGSTRPAAAMVAAATIMGLVDRKSASIGSSPSGRSIAALGLYLVPRGIGGWMLGLWIYRLDDVNLQVLLVHNMAKSQIRTRKETSRTSSGKTEGDVSYTSNLTIP